MEIEQTEHLRLWLVSMKGDISIRRISFRRLAQKVEINYSALLHWVNETHDHGKPKKLPARYLEPLTAECERLGYDKNAELAAQK
jgi:hypothetical protein